MALVADNGAWGGDGSVPAGPEAGDRLVIRAEQALLGAVLSDPRQAAILGLVRPGDMLRPYHGQVLAAMQRLRSGGVAPGPLRVREELAKDPDLPPRIALDGVLLAGLMEAAPRSGHVTAYAAMVVEHGIRQRIGLAGSRLAQAAETGDLDTVRNAAFRAGEEVDGCQERWNALPGPLRRRMPAPARNRAAQAEEAAWQLNRAREEIDRIREAPPAWGGSGLQERLASIAGRVAAAASAGQPASGPKIPAPGDGRPRGPGAEAAGERALRDLAAGPVHITAVRSWLQPGHFARPAHGQIYSLMRDMHHAGLPVDPVTVAWEAARHGIPADPADLGGGTAYLAVDSAREVCRDGLLARAAQAGRDLIAAAGEPRPTAGQLLRESTQRLRALDRDLGIVRKAPRPAEGGRGGSARTGLSGDAVGAEPGSEAVA
ncbi:MAG: DnaB-like helicase N-terminal domain-containing protein [Streptosporangiaceae bacterium]